MAKIVLARDEWVVVCDGRKALILENAGDDRFPSLKTREEHKSENPATHLQGAERAGKVQQSVGSARSAVGQTDWHDEAEHMFLKGIAKRINDAVVRGEAKGLVLIAPPRALGMLRPALSTAAGRLVRHQIDKDLVALPVGEIEKRLFG